MNTLIKTAALLAIANMELVPLRAKDGEDIEALKARQTDIEQEITVLKAKDLDDAQNAEALQAKESELDGVIARIEACETRAKNKQLETALLAQRKKDAQGAVQAAVKRGAIAPKDTETQERWERMCTEDAENISLLAKVPGSQALRAQRIIMPIRGEITREDTLTVLRAYGGERDPRKKAAIYASDLSKRIKDGEFIPLHAANSVGTLAGELVTQRTLELLKVMLPALSAFATDFSNEGANFNQQVNSRIVGIPTSSDYDESTGYEDNDATTVDVPVIIDEHKSVAIAFNVNELASTTRNLFGEQAEAMAHRVALDLVDKALAQITAANYTEPPTTRALIDFDREAVIAIGGALSDRGVPATPRSLLLAGTYYDKLFSDPAIVNLASHQRSELITGSQLLPIHDFNVFRVATLPTTNNLVGFGSSRSALVIATRVPNDYTQATTGQHGLVQQITNPETGITVSYVEYVDHKLGRTVKRLAYMYGAAKGQIKAGQRLVSS